MTSGQWAGTVAIDTFCTADDDHGNPCPWDGTADVDIDWESNTFRFTCGDGHPNEGLATYFGDDPR